MDQNKISDSVSRIPQDPAPVLELSENYVTGRTTGGTEREGENQILYTKPAEDLICSMKSVVRGQTGITGEKPEEC